MQRKWVVLAQLDEQLAGESGPRSGHRSGPYQMTSLAS
jgi:hypothetical protein